MSIAISVVVPAYNEELNIAPLYERLSSTLLKISENYEILFVDDGSRDRTIEEIRKVREKDPRVKYISFSRNFGHEMANSAGFRNAQGDAVVIIDADLQDPPETIYDMYEKYKEGYDIVFAKRLTRKKETFTKIVTSKAFYRVMRTMSEVELPLDTGDFRLLSRRAVDELNSFGEHNRFFRGLTHWVGFNITSVTFHRDERFAGETKYNYYKLTKLAVDAILSFSYRPLKFFSFIGALLSVGAFLMMIYWIGFKLITNLPVPGWTSLVTIMLLGFGILMMQLSLIGEYVARIYEEVRKRPLYIIGRSEGLDMVYGCDGTAKTLEEPGKRGAQ